MVNCPHCHKKTITLWDKLWSGSGSPIKCQGCGKLSYVHTKHQFNLKYAWPVIVTWSAIILLGYMFLKTNSLWWLVATPGLWVAGNIWELAAKPLSEITESESEERRKYGNIFLLIIITLVAVGALT